MGTHKIGELFCVLYFLFIVCRWHAMVIVMGSGPIEYSGDSGFSIRSEILLYDMC